MKIIETQYQSDFHKLREALSNLINQPSDKEQRPCPGCCIAVGQSQSQTSSEHCNAKCVNAPCQMSSDGERYPIEAAVVPLVYSFYSTRLLTPCWSCGGHYTQQGNSLKTPKLWFYSHNEFYVKLVAQYVCQLKAEQKLHNHWSVKLLPFSQSTFAITYSLEPEDTLADMTNLTLLQQDVSTIAENLREGIHQLAGQYIKKLDNTRLI